jgi:hypothetical protein
MAGVSGTLRKVKVAGLVFNCAADADINELLSLYENSAVNHSSGAAQKKVRRASTRESVVLITSASERSLLEEIANRFDFYALVYIDAEGNEYQSNGFIQIEGNTTQENRTTIQMIPSKEWVTFLA